MWAKSVYLVHDAILTFYKFIVSSFSYILSDATLGQIDDTIDLPFNELPRYKHNKLTPHLPAAYLTVFDLQYVIWPHRYCSLRYSITMLAAFIYNNLKE